MRAWSALRLGVVAAVASLSLSACGDDDGGTGVESVTLEVGPSGGTVELPGGGKVTIPANALSRMEMIKITKLDVNDVAALPSNMEPAGKPFAFEPHGLTFAQDVKIEVEYEGADMDVRPMKLPNEMADTSEWTTVFPSEKDMTMKRVSFDTRSFSVIWAARPRRSSGMVTLPDGAIVEDAGMSDGAVAGTGGGGTGGSDAGDAGGTGGTGGTDGGMDAGGTGGGDAGGADGGVTCLVPPTQIIPSLTQVDDVVHTGGGVLVAADGKVTRYIAPYDNPVDLILPNTNNNERFGGIAAMGGRVIATAGSSGSSTRIACADSSVNGTGSTTYFDLQTYSMYQVALNLGPVGYVPRSGHAVTDGFIAVVQEMTYGGIVVLDPTDCQPLAFMVGPDASNGPLTGAVGLQLLQGAILVAAIEKNSAPTFRGVRTWQVNDGITLLDEEAITAGRVDAINTAPSTLGTSYLLSIFPNPEFQLISVYVNSGDGQMLVDTQPFVTGTNGRQVRDVASNGGFVVAGTPLVGQTPMPLMEVFITGEGNVAESLGQVPLPTGFYGDRISGYPGEPNVYIAGPGLLELDLSGCW